MSPSSIGTGVPVWKRARTTAALFMPACYPANSLKARLCVEGRARLYEFCERRGVPHARTGKLVVATEPGDEARLTQLEARARANGVDDVRLVGREDIVARQPQVAATTALSPSTGLVAADLSCKALLQECRDRDVSWIPGTAVTDGMRTQRFDRSQNRKAGDDTREVVINAAGLHANDVSSALGGETFTIYPCRGNTRS